MENKGSVTAKFIMLNSLLFILLLYNIWIVVRVLFLNVSDMAFIIVLYSFPIYFILGILFIILGWHDMSAINKILPCIAMAAIIWLFFEQTDILPRYFMLIADGLVCIALVILTLRKLSFT